MKTISNHKGFTLIELLISMAIFGIVLVSLATFFSTQERSYRGQGMVISTQDNARWSMDFVIRIMKSLDLSTYTAISGVSIANPTITNENTDNSSIEFMAVEDFGMATGGASNTITDSTKSWTDDWQDSVVIIIDGTGNGQTKKIISNTSTVLTIDGTWSTTPDTTSIYQIASLNKFSKASGETILRYSKKLNTNGQLALSITSFKVQRYKSDGTTTTTSWTDTATIGVTVTARTSQVRPDTGEYGTVTFLSYVDMRN